MKFEDLVKAEPRLGYLLKRIKAEKPPTNIKECWMTRWYGLYDVHSYKQEMIRLVGFMSKNPNPVLKSSQAYDIAYQVLSIALPSCKQCKCKTCSESPEYDEYCERNNQYD